LISGNGYPNYLNVIENAIKDVNSLGNFDSLVIAVDSEDKAYQDKYDEIKIHLESTNHIASFKSFLDVFTKGA
jgi:hypothetical protein